MGSNAIGQLEEAIFLLRRQDARSWLEYLLGAVPFLLALLAFAHDMSAGYLAERCAFESLVCALAFFWSSAWKARFGGTLLAAMNGPGTPSPQGGFWHALCLQSMVQTLKLFTLPLAIASVLPLAWTSSFFRNAAIEASLPHATLSGVFSKAARRSTAGARGQWTGLLLVALATLVVFANLYILAGLLPLLVRTFSGYENLFTRHAASLFSYNIFCIVAAFTWLLIDPWMLAYSVVRCFYWEARTDGRDLLAKLRPAALALALLLALGCRLPAAEPVTSENLARALAQAERSDDYAWLHTHREASAGFADTLIERLNRDLARVGHAINSGFSALGRWLGRMLRNPGAGAEPESSAPRAGQDVRWLLYGMAALVLAIAILFLLRSLRKRPAPAPAPSRNAMPRDLRAENVLASDLPEEEWLRLARELLAQGEARLAVRALYLANLSYLGAQHFIQIAKAKTNSVYEKELRLRARASEAVAPFAQANRGFERVWYGFHEATPEFVAEFQQNVEAIRRHAKA